MMFIITCFCNNVFGWLCFHSLHFSLCVFSYGNRIMPIFISIFSKSVIYEGRRNIPKLCRGNRGADVLSDEWLIEDISGKTASFVLFRVMHLDSVSPACHSVQKLASHSRWTWLCLLLSSSVKVLRQFSAVTDCIWKEEHLI